VDFSFETEQTMASFVTSL